MKIFKINDRGHEVVYVQAYDLVYLMKNRKYAPTYFAERAGESGCSLLFLQYPNQFVRFTNPEEVAYFKRETVVIDYGEYRYIDNEQVREKCMTLMHYPMKIKGQKKVNIKNGEALDDVSHQLLSIAKIRKLVKRGLVVEEIVPMLTEKEERKRLFKRR